MADHLTRSARRALMGRVKTQDTAPELALRRALWAAGIRGWRIHPRQVAGRPDLAWPSRRLAVFVDGAFWHGHPKHYWGQSGEFWDAKIERNRRRDDEVTDRLLADGWTVLRFWDFEVEREVARCVASIHAALDSLDRRRAPVTDPAIDSAKRIRAVAKRLGLLADAFESGKAGNRETIDEAVAELRGVQVDRFGRGSRAARGQGAKSRILTYLLARTGQTVAGEELAEVSGIQEWARRVRELRVEDGYAITKVGARSYRLESDQPDLDRAAAWKTASVIRRRKGSAKERIEAFLEARVGTVVDREQIDYVARISEAARRVRELRDEHGWPINSHIDEADLEPGQYRLTSTEPDDRRDPLQRLYPEGIREAVFERDEYTCQMCGRDRAKAEAAGDTRFYLEVHHKTAVAEDELRALPQEELNRLENLTTLCHADHREETAKLQRRRRRTRQSARKGR